MDASDLRSQLVYLHAAVADDLRHNAEEGQLLVERLDALVSGVVQLPGAVEVQDVAEHLRVPVEEVLLRVLVVEELLLRGAQQRVGVAVQRVLPRLPRRTSNAVRPGNTPAAN